MSPSPTYPTPIQAIFCDLGGVVLTNGWDHHARQRAILQFELEASEVDERHNVYFPLHELGQLSLDEYLDGVIFYRRRPFSRNEFIDFIHQQSHADTAMLQILRRLKLCRPFTLVAFSNEGAEIARYRAQKFHLLHIFDIYFVSAFVHLRKPDPAFYKLALDLVQLSPQEVLYIDDRSYLVQAGSNFGLDSYQHTSANATAAYLEKHLQLVEGALKI